MDGTISLGIYDRAGKLVRTLHKEATGDEFVAALDGYITHWDGLDDAGKPMPPGRYTARGYMVGPVTPMGASSWDMDVIAGGPYPKSTGTSDAAIAARIYQPDVLKSALEKWFGGSESALTLREKIHAVLLPNPLDRDRAGNADLTAGFDATGGWLKLADGLPLKRITTTPNLKWVSLGKGWSSPRGEDGSICFLQTDGVKLEVFSLRRLSSMMAFDCGPFDLPAK
jgi:hypothetical protein